jgi:hypothetical protein
VKVWAADTGQCVNTLFFDQVVATVTFFAGQPLRLGVADRSGRVFCYEVVE